MSNKNKDDCTRIIREKLTNRRFIHSLRVAEQAVTLAERFGADTQKAEIAALLHDISKEENEQNQLKIIKEFGIILSVAEKKENKLLHAIAGAAYIEHVLGVSDRDILNAVRYHTTARPGMSVLEKVLYLADFTSADRDFDGLEPIKRAVEQGMDCGMMEALSFSLRDLAQRRRVIHPDTVDAYNQFALCQ